MLHSDPSRSESGERHCPVQRRFFMPFFTLYEYAFTANNAVCLYIINRTKMEGRKAEFLCKRQQIPKRQKKVPKTSFFSFCGVV